MSILLLEFYKHVQYSRRIEYKRGRRLQDFSSLQFAFEVSITAGRFLVKSATGILSRGCCLRAAGIYLLFVVVRLGLIFTDKTKCIPYMMSFTKTLFVHMS